MNNIINNNNNIYLETFPYVVWIIDWILMTWRPIELKDGHIDCGGDRTWLGVRVRGTYFNFFIWITNNNWERFQMFFLHFSCKLRRMYTVQKNIFSNHKKETGTFRNKAASWDGIKQWSNWTYLCYDSLLGNWSIIAD